MDNKIFVGGLSWGITDELLQQAFDPYGQVSEAIVITDRDTNRSRGFGFVTFADSASAQEAISEMNGTVLDGREINVNVARQRQERRNARAYSDRW